MRSLRRSVGFVGVAAIVLSMVAVVDSTTASATVPCLSAYGSEFAGLLSQQSGPGGTYEGASSQIDVGNGPICDTGSHGQDNFHFVWSMIAENESAGGARGYVQSGYLRYWNGCTYWTTEYNKGPGDTFHRHIHTEDGCKTFGSNRYWVQYIPSTGFERMNVDSTVLDTTPWDIYVEWAAHLPFEPEFSGETKYIGSDIPGTSSNTTTLGSLQVQQFSDAWSSTLPSFLSICPWPVRYVRTGLSGNAFQIYSTTSTSTNLNC